MALFVLFVLKLPRERLLDRFSSKHLFAHGGVAHEARHDDGRLFQILELQSVVHIGVLTCPAPAEGSPCFEVGVH